MDIEQVRQLIGKNVKTGYGNRGILEDVFIDTETGEEIALIREFKEEGDRSGHDRTRDYETWSCPIDDIMIDS